MLTQQLKNDWLDALQSGKYIRGTGKLKDIRDGVIRHCCLGVLAEICPNMTIAEDGRTIVEDGLFGGYKLFNNMLKEPVVEKLYRANDAVEESFNSTYSDVIPIIQSLSTTN